MGFMRKALFLGTGGLSGMAGVRANSKKERTAKAAEKQVRRQKQAMARARDEQKISELPIEEQCGIYEEALLNRARGGTPNVDPSVAARMWAECEVELRRHRPQSPVLPENAHKRPDQSGAEPAPLITDEIARLAQLHAQGTLTDDEFAATKAKIIGAKP